MNPLALMFFLVCAAALLSVPRQWAPVPLLIGCTYMTLGQGIDLGGISLPIYRMLLLVGVLRVMTKGEWLPGGLNLIDRLMLAWAGWVVFASFFHDPQRAGPVYACGVVFNQALFYFLIRTWSTDLDQIRDVLRIVAVVLVPVAAEMFMEVATGRNCFAIFGGVPDLVVVREGRFRAQGPFRHPILAGTVGATCIPLFIGIFNRHRSYALLGIAAATVMVFASASSGPVVSLLAGLGALGLWRFKDHLGKLRWLALLIYLGLWLVMTKPPYYLISRIDLSGGSTGWHRAFLIEQTISYLSEWWLFGTDYTRHWMPMQGTANDPNHTDITNLYIGFGVMGGLAGMLLIIAMIVVAFRWVGKIHDVWLARSPDQSFMIWCVGACLFAHTVTGLSVAYFDQSMLYYWLSVAAISSIYALVQMADEPAATVVEEAGTGIDVLAERAALNQANAEWRRKLRERAAANGG